MSTSEVADRLDRQNSKIPPSFPHRVNREIAGDLIQLTLLLSAEQLNVKEIALHIGTLQVSMILSKDSELL